MQQWTTTASDTIRYDTQLAHSSHSFALFAPLEKCALKNTAELFLIQNNRHKKCWAYITHTIYGLTRSLSPPAKKTRVVYVLNPALQHARGEIVFSQNTDTWKNNWNYIFLEKDSNYFMFLSWNRFQNLVLSYHHLILFLKPTCSATQGRTRGTYIRNRGYGNIFLTCKKYSIFLTTPPYSWRNSL